MPLVFDDYTLQIAQSLAKSRVSKDAPINLAYYLGDHWQAGVGWTGPMPQSTDDGYATTQAEIKKAFVSRNAIGEVVDRHAGGVLGRELHWKFSVKRPLGKVTTKDEITGQEITKEEQPSDEEQALITEAEQALTTWWDKHQTPNKLQDMVRLALLAKRAVLRIYVPPGLRDEAGNIPTGKLDESLDRIWFQHLGTNEDTLDLQLPSATVYTDKLTRRDIGIFTYREAPEKPDGADGPEMAELSYVDEAGNTILRIIGNDDAKEDRIELPLGGRLTMHEMTRRALIGEQIVSQQKLLNLAETMKQRNVVLGGFLERVLLNAQLPGRYIDNADGTKRFIPDPMQVGAGTTNNLQGIIYKDAQGNEQITNPGVVYRDPVPVTTFSETSDSAYLSILEEAQQLHYALAGDAVVSAVSRIQAQAAFQKDLLISAVQVEAAARWLLETVLAMAAHFSNQSERFAGLRAVVQARVDSGPISADEKRVAIEMRDGGLWATETAMSASGIEDVDSEKERIEREQQQQQSKDAAAMASVKTAMDKLNPPKKDPKTGEEVTNPLTATFPGKGN